MIKIILPNNKIHSFSYNQDAPIKEILKQFYAKKGLLADIYELDDSKMNVPIDDNKSPKDYKLNSINLRRVKEPYYSLENEFQTIVNNGDYKSLQSPSSGKPNRFQFWKPKANKIPKKDHANSFSVMPSNQTNEDPYQNATLGKKQKRQAPLPPICSDNAAANLFEYSVQDVYIPSPPPIRDLPSGTRPSFMWLTDASTATDTFSDMYGSIHSFNSRNSFSSSASISKEIGTFISVPLIYASNSSSINSPIATETTNEDDFSDPELHEYATISKRVNKNVTDIQITNNLYSVDTVDGRLSGISLKGDAPRKTKFNIIHNKSENQNLPLENNRRKNVEGPPKSSAEVVTSVTSEKPTNTDIHEVVHEIQIPKPACVNDNDKINDYNELQEVERTVASANVPESNLDREAIRQGPPITISKPQRGTGKNKSEVNLHSSTEEAHSLRPVHIISKPGGMDQDNQKPDVIVNNSKEVNEDTKSPEIAVKETKEAVVVNQESDNREADLTSRRISENSLQKDRLRCVQKPQGKSLFFTAN